MLQVILKDVKLPADFAIAVKERAEIVKEHKPKAIKKFLKKAKPKDVPKAQLLYAVLSVEHYINLSKKDRKQIHKLPEQLARLRKFIKDNLELNGNKIDEKKLKKLLRDEEKEWLLD